MIHFVTSQNCHLYTEALQEMHRLRKAIFIDELGWPLTIRDDGGEYDEYDDARTMYLIGFDADRQIEISMRIRPTDDGRCMIANHFPQLVGPDGPPICAPGVWEGSRIFSVPKLRASPAARRRNHDLHLATIEAAARYGIRRVLGMVDAFWLTRMHQALWRTRVIGPTIKHESSEIVAFEIDSSPESVQEGREKLGVDTVLIELDAGTHDMRWAAEA